MPISDTTLSLTGAPNMTVSSFITNIVGTPVFDSAGKYTFTVGATLAVNAFQPGGLYSGTFEVTVVPSP